MKYYKLKDELKDFYDIFYHEIRPASYKRRNTSDYTVGQLVNLYPDDWDEVENPIKSKKTFKFGR